MVNFKKMARKAINMFPGTKKTASKTTKATKKKKSSKAKDESLSTLMSPMKKTKLASPLAKRAESPKTKCGGLTPAFIAISFGTSKYTYKVRGSQ